MNQDFESYFLHFDTGLLKSLLVKRLKGMTIVMIAKGSGPY